MNLIINFFALFKAIQCTVYVMTGERYMTTVTSFADVARLSGPIVFQADGPLFLTSPRNACLPIGPVPQIPVPINLYSPTTLELAEEDLEFPIIALIEVGDCELDVKIWNAQQSGYSAVIVFGSAKGGSILPLDGSTFASRIHIPSVLITKEDGKRLQTYTWSQDQKYLISLVGSQNWPTKYVIIGFILVLIATVLIILSCVAIYFCNAWYRSRTGRLSKRQLRRLRVKSFTKGQDPYETCVICLDDYEDHQKLRLLPCQHAFHRDCIDHWLLSKRSRCPICNRTVDFSAPTPGPGRYVSLRLIVLIRRLRRFIFRFGNQSTTVLLNSGMDDANEDDSRPLLISEDAEPTVCPLLQHTYQAFSDSSSAYTPDEPLMNPLEPIETILPVLVELEHQTTETCSRADSRPAQTGTRIKQEDDEDLISVTGDTPASPAQQLNRSATANFFV